MAEDTAPEMLPELIDVFMMQAKERLNSRQKAAELDDFNRVEAEARALEGSAALAGLNRFLKAYANRPASTQNDTP